MLVRDAQGVAASISARKRSHRVRETLINSANEMKHEAHGTQQPRHINMIVEGVSAAQRSDSLVQLINQHFPNNLSWNL